MADHDRKNDLLEATRLVIKNEEANIPVERTEEIHNDQHSRANGLITENGITNGGHNKTSNIDTELTTRQSYDCVSIKCRIYKTVSLYLLFSAQVRHFCNYRFIAHLNLY